jgi:hypothetical protein
MAVSSPSKNYGMNFRDAAAASGLPGRVPGRAQHGGETWEDDDKNKLLGCTDA